MIWSSATMKIHDWYWTSDCTQICHENRTTEMFNYYSWLCVLGQARTDGKGRSAGFAKRLWLWLCPMKRNLLNTFYFVYSDVRQWKTDATKSVVVHARPQVSEVFLVTCWIHHEARSPPFTTKIWMMVSPTLRTSLQLFSFTSWAVRSC